MEKEQIAIGKSVLTGKYSITPITRSYLSWKKSGSGMFLICHKSPLAVIVTGSRAKVNVHLIAQDISLEYLIEKVPELEALLNCKTNIENLSAL